MRQGKFSAVWTDGPQWGQHIHTTKCGARETEFFKVLTMIFAQDQDPSRDFLSHCSSELITGN